MAELRSLASALMVATTVILLSGCGLFVPQPHEFYEPGNSDAIFLNTIVNNIKCELKKGAYEALAYLGNNPEAAWLRQWGAKVDLTFTTGETGEFNPSVVLTPPSPFFFSFNIDSSAHATRVEEVAFTYAFQELLNGITSSNAPKKCDNENGILIQSDLDIADFIFKNVFITTIPDTTPDVTKTFFETLQYIVTFVASYGANATPTWIFKHVKVDTLGTLLTASRSKTSNLIITFSRVSPAGPAAPAQLFPEGLMVHNAALIGQAVGTANQSVLR